MITFTFILIIAIGFLIMYYNYKLNALETYLNELDYELFRTRMSMKYVEHASRSTQSDIEKLKQLIN